MIYISTICYYFYLFIGLLFFSDIGHITLFIINIKLEKNFYNINFKQNL